MKKSSRVQGWESQVEGRDPSPEEVAIRKEEARDDTLALSTGVEHAVVRKVWREMRRLKPHLYVVLRSWTDLLPLRDEPTQYSSRVYRGFYAELARKLGVTENAVKHRLQSGIRWFAGRIRCHAGEETAS